jgi:salicylate hydroxylase
LTGTRVERPRIAILGGGVGGLATAAFLHRVGLPSTVYEQASEMREVGAGRNATVGAR